MTDKVEEAAAKAAATDSGVAEGAQSVANAVKRMADAAVEAATKVKSKPAQAFQFFGGKQDRFEIQGDGFSTNGTVKVNGQQAKTTEWGNERIVGQMPEGVKAGQVVVEVAVDADNVQRGTFTV